ncbi:hypothetical protein [Fischerella thermalis]|uniref:hypothetical protein n=1 Tax=Fischerella thermalis TaxID=372787 RepID=UPI000C80C52C|nr:hypothetical protein [Fischerella thermalis]MBF1989358.1 hypothetical protein [Fischerella thermalis M58_A2018_009]MBF2061828.1 hypothetical protein [Fischerella thermalis M66_A2018_004]MBF2068624.1 hypothetical protein [Fischerella thermalis M48_A2018_028]PLZ88606.1 hypothetical protein CI593_13560 [Fischerella thermalis CCMEE 5194]
MKAQLLLIFTLLVVNSGVAHSQTPVPNPQIPTTPTVAPTTTVTPKSSSQSNNTKASHKDLLKALEEVDKGFTTLVFLLIKILVALLSLFVIRRFFLLITNRSSQLIIDNFSNATGADEIEGVLTGLSQLARERLAREMKSVYQRSKEHITSVGPQIHLSSDKFPLPQATANQQLTNFISSVKELTPDQIDPLVQLLAVLFPPYGTKVTGILQSQGEEHKRIGITFEIQDIDNRIAAQIYTIWEVSDSEVGKESKRLLKDRFRQLLRTASRWLALELSKREMIRSIPKFYLGSKRQRYLGQIHNFFGVLNQSSAQTHGQFFYQLAIEELQQAIEFYPDWYQPYDNLAETYSLLGRTQGERRIGNLQSAIAHYDEALKRVTEPTVQLRIKVAKAITQLLTGKEDLILAAKQEIQNLETAKNWDATKVLNYRLLYYLACWYALAYCLDNADETQKRAYLYLTYSLTRDKSRDFWEWVGKDPDLESIRGRLPELKSALLKKLNEKPELPTLTGKDFNESIEEVLGAVSWGSREVGGV